jgi:hypothetical protein
MSRSTQAQKSGGWPTFTFFVKVGTAKSVAGPPLRFFVKVGAHAACVWIFLLTSPRRLIRTSPVQPDELLAVASSYDESGRIGAQTPSAINWLFTGRQESGKSTECTTPWAR